MANMQPIVQDQYTAARAYFLCVIGLLFLESAVHLPPYLLSFRKRGRSLVQNASPHSKFYSSIHKLLTFPSPFPFLTNYGLPSLIRLAAFIGLNILWGWNDNQFTTDFKLYGWLTIANGGLALLMASRSNLFAIVMRIPSSTLLMYHRWIGLATVVHATIHFVLNTRHYLETDQLVDSYMNLRIQIGIMAWIALCVIAVTSFSFIRRRWFEAFYYAHALFFVFVVGALIHATKGPEFLLPGLLLWGIDRAIRLVNNFRTIEVKSVKQFAGDLTKFKIEGLRTTNPGQIAWVQIPGVSFLNWHPFTIASAPGDKETVIAVRGLGGYTRRMQSLVADANGSSMEKTTTMPSSQLKMRLDGPYGVGNIRWVLHPVIVLVAGGVGITPGISIASHIIRRATQPDAELNDPRGWRIHLLWIIKDSRHTQWFEEELKSLASLASDPAVPVTLTVTIHVTGSSSSRTESMGQEEAYVMEETHAYDGPGDVHTGRPNLGEYFGNIQRACAGQSAAVNLCGPRHMIDAARKAAANASVGGTVFHVEEEVFEL